MFESRLRVVWAHSNICFKGFLRNLLFLFLGIRLLGGPLRAHPVIMFNLVDLLQDGRNEKAACKEPHKEESYHAEGLLETANVSQELHDRVHATIVSQVPLIVAKVKTHQNAFSRRDRVVIGPNV